MMMMIAATLAAAAPVAPAQPMDAHADHMQMSGHEQHPGQMADMKDCCCKEMDKMHGDRAGHDDHAQR